MNCSSKRRAIFWIHSRGYPAPISSCGRQMTGNRCPQNFTYSSNSEGLTTSILMVDSSFTILSSGQSNKAIFARRKDGVNIHLLLHLRGAISLIHCVSSYCGYQTMLTGSQAHVFKQIFTV